MTVAMAASTDEQVVRTPLSQRFLHALKSSKRRLWNICDLESQFHSRGSPTQFSPQARSFISKVVISDVVEVPSASVHQQAYLDYVRAEAQNLPLSALQGTLSSKGLNEKVDVDDIFHVMAGMADCALADDQFGIDSTIEFLVKRQVFRQIDQGTPEHAKTRKILFILFSWLSMLYSPTGLDAAVNHLQIDENQAIDLSTTTQDIGEARNPMWELMQQFGQLLPARQLTHQEHLPRSPDKEFSADALYVSLLNVSTLENVGLIKVTWVNNLSSHLSFDSEKRVLMVFRWPSYTYLNRFETTLFPKLIAKYYDNYSRPDNFSTTQLFREVRRSYRLLFGDDDRAYNRYLKTWRSAAHHNGLLDPYLDELCKMAPKTSASRNSYGMRNEFPILGPRLALLQEYIQRQNSKSIKMLWLDRRDVLRWYTFWAVAVIGVLGITLALCQIGLSAAQVALQRVSNSQS